MSAIINGLNFLLLAEGGAASNFYNEYLNIPGFEAWKFINLAIFVAILVYLGKKSLSPVFIARREAIRAELIQAEEERKAALARLTAAEARLAQLETEKAAILERARTEAQADRQRLLEDTEFEIQRIRAQADAEVIRIAQLSRAGIKRLAAEESIRLAEQKLRTQINADNDSRLVKASIQEIGGLN